jgi:hypothetical protein
VTELHVVLTEQPRVCRHADHGDTAGDQKIVEGVHGGGVVFDVLEHVVHHDRLREWHVEIHQTALHHVAAATGRELVRDAPGLARSDVVPEPTGDVVVLATTASDVEQAVSWSNARP